jgi:hypothetical protein
MKNEYTIEILRDSTSKDIVRRIKYRRMLPVSPAKLLSAFALLFAVCASSVLPILASSEAAHADVLTDIACVTSKAGQQGAWTEDDKKFGPLGGYTPTMLQSTQKADADKVIRPSANAVTGSVNYRLTAYEKYGSNFPLFSTWTPAVVEGDFTFAGVSSNAGLGTGSNIESGSTNGSVVQTSSTSRMVAQDIGKCGNLGGNTEAWIANSISLIPRLFLSLSSEVYSTSTDVSLSNEDSFLHSLLDAVDDKVIDLRDAFFVPFLIPLILMGAVYIAWVGIIKRGAMQAVQGTVWMIAAIAAGTVFLAQPSFLAVTMDGFVSEVQGSLNNNLSVANDASELCQATGDMYSKREAACTMWEASVYNVWESGQFGNYASDTTDPRGILNNSDYEIQYGNASVNATSWGQFQLDRQATGSSLQESEVAYAQLASNGVNGGNEVWAGGHLSQITAAITMWVTVPVHAAVPLFFGILQISYQLMTLVLIMASPFFFLLGVIPNFGRGVLMRFAEMMVSIVLKRIITTLLLAVYFIFYSAIATSETVIIVQIFAIAAIAGGILYARRWLLNITANKVDFGGDKRFGLPGAKAAGYVAGLGGAAAGAAAGAVVGGGGTFGALTTAFGALAGGNKARKATRSENSDMEGSGFNKPTADAKIPNRSKGSAPFPNSAAPRLAGDAAGAAVTATGVGAPAAGVAKAGASEATKKLQSD